MLITAGPLGRSVTDVAVLLTALAAANPSEPASPEVAQLAETDFTQYLSKRGTEQPARAGSAAAGSPLGLH